MKKRIFALMAAAILGMSVNVAAAETEPLAHYENADGSVNVVGATINPNDSVFYVLLEYENGTNKSNAPAYSYVVKAYQNGIELSPAASLGSPTGYYSSITSVQAGGTLPYYTMYTLSDASPVDVEVAPLVNMANESATCTISLTDGNAEESTGAEADYKEMYEGLKAEYDALLSKYNELLEKATAAGVELE